MAAAVTCAALAAGGAYVVFTRQPVEATAPVITASMIPEPIPVAPDSAGGDTASGAAAPPPKRPPKAPPDLPIATVVTTTTAAEENGDVEDKHDEERATEIERLRRRAIDALTVQLDERFRDVREKLDTQRFDEAREELKSMVTLARLYPDDLWQQLQMIEQLQAEEPFVRRLATVERKLREEAWIEADYLAKDLATDGDVPGAVAERAREIRQQLKELRGNGFRETHTGPTTNDIVRKPSSPPRKHL
jgi:hypothetical protein